MIDDTTDELQRQLAELRQERRDLDAAISLLSRTGEFDQIKLQRLKKRKLMLKDQIAKVESLLHPDIIA